MAVDVTRRVYTRRARLFSDSDREVTLKWYFCKPGAKTLPLQTAINMVIYRNDPWSQRGIGEVPENEPRWVRTPTPESALGQRYCTPDQGWFLHGQPYRPNMPPSPRDPWGLLACCPQPPAAPGGVMWDGRALVGDVVYGSGGTAWAGEALASRAVYGAALCEYAFGPSPPAIEDVIGFVSQPAAWRRAYLQAGQAYRIRLISVGAGTTGMDVYSGPAVSNPCDSMVYVTTLSPGDYVDIDAAVSLRFVTVVAYRTGGIARYTWEIAELA